MAASLQALNNVMHGPRVSVEHAFARVVALFPFVDYTKKVKLFHNCVGETYSVAVLLMNVITVHVCVRVW